MVGIKSKQAYWLSCGDRVGAGYFFLSFPNFLYSIIIYNFFFSIFKKLLSLF